MQYHGGKSYMAKALVTTILSDTNKRDFWIEPFVGGGNVMEHAAPHFQVSIGMDAHPDLILMWNAAKSGIAPPLMTENLYRELRHAKPSALRGYAGFGCSFGGKWFGGWAAERREHNYAAGSMRVIHRQGLVFRDCNTTFVRCSFGSTTPPPGSVVYCDPPYVNTTGYSDSLDYDFFYRTLRKWTAQGSVCYVSGYDIPNAVPADMVWEGKQIVRAGRRKPGEKSKVRNERLYRIRDL